MPKTMGGTTMRSMKTILSALLLLTTLTGCGASPALVPETTQAAQEETVPLQELYVEPVVLEIEADSQEAVIFEEAPEAAIPDILEPVASGERVEQTEKAIIDYSHTEDGYIMILYTGDCEKKLKVQLKGPGTTYTYNLYRDEWAVYPFSDGNGSYQVKVFENISGKQYSLAMATEVEVDLTDEFAPFVRPNQYVDYTAASKAVEKGLELTQGIENPLEKVQVIYDYVVAEVSYDEEKAKNVKSGYLPVLDTVLEEKKGICFDYAALMTGMLRSQGIPCKMVFGYAGSAYHAWISVWTEETGWVDGVIFFDGVAWQRLDPTFASSSDRSEKVMKFIGNGKNYKEVYFY